MKISKTAVLTAGSALMMAGLGLMFVSAADKTLFVDPNNAIQHFEKVRIVPTESGDNSMADIVKTGNLVGIKTDYNFALSRSGTDANQISENTMGSSILGGIVNKILGGIYNGILGGKNNVITTGNNNGILGGENNKIGGNYSVIFGGMGNEIGSGSYSAIVGGSGNEITKGNLVVVGRNNRAGGYNSVAMGSGSRFNATSSFLWTDGIYSGNFTTNHVFAVLGDKGMVINAEKAHDLAQLTISGSLVVYDDKNAPVCNNDTKGVLKVVDGNASNTNQKCFCSCDGSGRNSLYESSKCPEICSNETTRTGDRCGGVVRDCNSNPYVYTGNAVSGACVYGELVNGTGAFLVSTEKSGGVLTNYINRSCQSSNGEVRICRDELKGEGCPNHYTGECLWREGTDTGHIVLSDNKSPESTAEYWEYSITGVNNSELCKYKCDDESERDSVAKRCVPFECEGVLETGAVENNPGLLPKSHGVKYIYAPTSGAACTYHCTGDYQYNPETEKCELCPEGRVFKNGGCKPVCDIDSTVKQDLEVFFISLTGSISHYTMMDRNLGAIEAFNQNISSPNKKSYGCYFQWGNNYPFNAGRSGSSYITGTLTNTKDYGPNAVNGYYLNSKRHCRQPSGESGYVMYPVDNSNYPYATWLWGGGATSDGINYIRAGWGTGGTDEDRQGPCPDGYHIPRGIEMKNIMQEWKDVSDCPYDTGTIALQKTKQFASELLLPFAGYNGIGCPQNEYKQGGTNGNYLISDYIYSDYRNHLHMGISSAGDGLYLYLNGPSYGYSIRCVKNNISANQKVTINANGGTKAVIAIDWETPNQGTIVTLGEPERTGYTFGGWYKDAKFTTKVDKGGKISSNGQLNAKWEEKLCNVESTAIQDLELFMLSYTGNISHFVMMDRSLGATEVYNQNPESQNKSSFGCYFQWGNNYGFPMTGFVKTQEQVSVSGYGPGKYYSSDKFFCNTDESPINRFNRDDSEGWEDLWGGKTNTDSSKRGPCPSGYHIPSVVELQNLVNLWTGASNGGRGSAFAHDTLTPFNGAITPRCDGGWGDGHNTSIKYAGSFWTTNHTASNLAFHLGIGYAENGKGEVNPRRSNSQSHAFPVRCVKNNQAAISQKITINANGGTGAVISIDWETPNQGKIVALGEPTKAGYTFGGWYKESSFTTRVNKGDTISNGGQLHAKWTADDPGNGDDTVAKDLDVYFLKSDGSVAHDTLMDRNMGATEIYNQNYTNPNKASYGYHYQWGNNYGFPSEGDVTTSLFQVDASGYGPGRYYNNGMFIAKSAGFYDWSSVQNDNLWGGSGDYRSNNWGYNTGNNMAINVTWRQGPCPAGYHVPSYGEWKGIYDNWNNANTVTTNKERQWASDLLLPFAGERSSKSAVLQGQGSHGACWSSTAVPDEEGIEAFLLTFWTNGLTPDDRGTRAVGHSLRCFKNSDNSQVLTIHPNEGTNAVIAVDGNVITALGTPKRAGYTFEGWYKDAKFTTRVDKGDTISNGGQLYAKWVSNDCKIIITYDPREGTLQAGRSEQQKIDCGMKVTLPSATKTGSVFVAWWDLSNGTRAGGAGDPYTGGWTDVTLYASWTGQSPQPEKNCKIDFETNGGSGVASQTFACGGKGRNTTTTKACNTFGNWYDDTSLKTAHNWNNAVTGNITLYAKWTPNKYTITYDANVAKGGQSVSKTGDSVYGNSGVDLTKVTATGQDGYTFIGWNTSSTATTALTGYTMPCENKTLYAIYQKQNTNPIDITITCKANYETKKPSIANACVDTTLVSTTYTASQELPVDVYIAQQKFVKGSRIEVGGSCGFHEQAGGGDVYKISANRKTSTKASNYNNTVSVNRDSMQGYDGLLWHGLSSFVESSWATATQRPDPINFPQTMTKEHTASNGQKYNIILQDCLPYVGIQNTTQAKCGIASGQSYDSHGPIYRDLCSVGTGSTPTMKPGKWVRTCATDTDIKSCSAYLITGSSTNPDPQPGNNKYCFGMRYNVVCSEVGGGVNNGWVGCDGPIQWDKYVTVNYYPSCSEGDGNFNIQPADGMGQKKLASKRMFKPTIESSDICNSTDFSRTEDTSYKCYFRTLGNGGLSHIYETETCSKYVLVDSLDTYSGWYKCAD